MLKSDKRTCIITSEVRWNVMNSNVLISTAMISTIWDKHHKDSLDVMMPFLKYAIAKETQVGNVVDIDKVVEVFKQEFGYYTIPQNVIIAMMNRLSPNILTKKHGKYTLAVTLDTEITDFEKRRTIYKEHREQVGNALSEFLNKNIGRLVDLYDEEKALSALTSFFVANGLIVAQLPEQLSLLRKEKDGKINYCIARFLIDEHKRETAIFDYVTDMVKGFFVSTAISFQPENLTLSNAKFKNLHCYLDTRIILDALGLRLQSSRKAAVELLEMLKDQQAVICCFEHTVDEVRDIIKAYRNSLANPNGSSIHTLEGWDEIHYSIEQVSRYLTVLEKKIEALGVRIIACPVNHDSKIRGLKVTQFKEELKKRIGYTSVSARDHDILSVLSVMQLRTGRRVSELEKCEHIFVTTNIPLIEVANECLYDADFTVSPAIADTTLSSIVWFKCSDSHKNYPLHKLIENALLALEPSHALLKDFYTAIDQYMATGGVSEEEAAIIRTDIQIRRELMNEVMGDSALIDSGTVERMREKLRAKYIGDNKKEAEDNYQQYLKQKEKNAQALNKIVAEIEQYGELWKKRVSKLLTHAIRIIFLILFVVFVGITIAAFVGDHNYWIGAVVILVLDIVGVYDLLSGRKQIIKSMIKKISNWCADKAIEKKRKEFASIISTLTDSDVGE